MSIEEEIRTAVEVGLAPLRAEIRRLSEEIAATRRALPPSLVTFPIAAKALGISVATLRRRVRDGSLPCQRVGRSVRIDLTELRPKTNAEILHLVAKARPG